MHRFETGGYMALENIYHIKRVELHYQSSHKHPTIETWYFVKNGKDIEEQAQDIINYLNNDNQKYKWWVKIKGIKILD